VWSGEEWITMGGGGITQAVIGDFDFSEAKINGIYVAGHPLRSSSNTMTIKIDVQRKGTYRITAEAIKSDDSNDPNGYTFMAMGEVLSVGVQEITLVGQGTPISPSKYKNIINNEVEVHPDYFEININGKLYDGATSSLSNNVLDVPAEYIYECINVSANGDYTHKTQMKSSNFIQINNVYNSGQAVDYHFYTDEINGIKFEAEGTMSKGFNNVTMKASGTPLNGGSYSYKIYSNSILSNPDCSVTINVKFQTFKILLCSNADDTWNLRNATRTVPLATKNSSLFGLTGSADRNYSAPAVVESITLISTGTTASIADDVDMVITGFGGTIDNAQLKSFVSKAGKTLVISNETDNDISNFASEIGSSVNRSDDSDGDNIMQLLAAGVSSRVDSILNRNYKLNGLYIGRDGGTNRSYNGNDWLSLIKTGYQQRIIVHKTLPIILAGDGGIFSGGLTNSTTVYWNPARVDSSGIPINIQNSVWTQPIHNSELLINIIMWAIDNKLKNN
jgi:hypothetical protein